jgi:hypothetical protein
MAETFDCPKCGAPINYDPDKFINQQTMSCPYCGESVIIPENLRRSAPVMTDTIVTDTRRVTDVRRPLTGFLVVGIAVALIICAVTLFTVSSIRSSLLRAIGESVPTSPAEAVHNLFPTIAPLLTDVADIPNTQIETPTPADSPTPTVDTTATAQVANNILFEQQSNWPVILQEKFVNDQRNWDIGVDNNDKALEEYSIAGGKYTWKITSKKSMGTFAFPDMPVQTDLYVSADIQMTTANDDPNDRFGIVIRMTPKDDTFYFFGVDTSGTYSLSMYDGNWHDMLANQTDHLKPDQVNHLAVSMQGSQIILSINNVVVDSYQDDQLPSGDAGLGAYLDAPGEDATIVFSNLTVRAPKK